MQRAVDEPKWAWFWFGNLVALAVFCASTSYTIGYWVSEERVHAAGFALTQPIFVLCTLGALSSLLYFFTFFGVAFIYRDVEDMMARGGQGTVGRQFATPASASTSPVGANTETDCDVAIIGMGIAGASLAAVLGRQGKKVMVIESTRNPHETIKGELMQPGGIRALERMGLSQCAKAAEIDGVRVDGYVCVALPGSNADARCSPSNGSSSTSAESTKQSNGIFTGKNGEEYIVLTYPNDDPKTVSEYLGLSGTPASNPESPSSSAASSPSISRTPSSANMIVTQDNAKNAPKGSVGSGLTEVCPVTGMDLQPKGRSFHHVRFVKQLRQAAIDESNVTVCWGLARKLIHAKEYAAVKAARAAKSGGSSSVSSSSNSSLSFTDDPDRVVGVMWQGEDGGENTIIARVVVVSDGMFSPFRNELHDNKGKRVSHFCGLILHHKPYETPLPFPNRGHVVMTSPTPTLFYQISSTDTRVLVDVPQEHYEKGVKNYFLNNTAPQLPEELRKPFLDAVNSQEPRCMPCIAISGAPPKKRGAIMIGDVLNMRHPLTGGGMTVALKDVELLSKQLSDLVLTSEQAAATSESSVSSEAELEAAIQTFYARRHLHASTINILANALYRVFSRPDNDADGTRGRLRSACIEYLSMGGAFSAGPVGLLSGLTPKPWVLVAHFFAVALFAMQRALLPLPTPTRIRQGYDLMHVACMIIMPLLAAERATILSWLPIRLLIDLIFPWSDNKLWQ